MRSRLNLDKDEDQKEYVETKAEKYKRRVDRARALLKDRTPLVLGKYPKNINMNRPLDETVEIPEGNKIEWAYTGKG